MATAKVSRDTEFEVVIIRIKSEIENGFRELIAQVRERERELLQQLEEISTAHRKEREKQERSISELEVMLKLTRENISSESLKELQETVVEKFREKRKEFDAQIDSRTVGLGWDDSVILDLVRKLGVLTVTGIYGTSTSVVDYTGRKKPIMHTGTRGNAEAQFNNPWGISIHHKSGNIYVADQWNHRVQVFDSESNFLFSFGAIIGRVGMDLPLYIAVTNDQVIVSQFRIGCLRVYDLGGNFIGQIGSRGNGNVQFNNPFGIAVSDSSGDIYVCDNTNNRVQILSKYFCYKSEIVVRAPRDIKLTTQHINVLTAHSPFLLIFNYEHSQIVQNMWLLLKSGTGRDSGGIFRVLTKIQDTFETVIMDPRFTGYYIYRYCRYGVYPSTSLDRSDWLCACISHTQVN